MRKSVSHVFLWEKDLVRLIGEIIAECRLRNGRSKK
jgi:hypothetical protein